MASETSTLDVVTVVVAGYAALVGTFALAFQAIAWLRSWSTRVESNAGATNCTAWVPIPKPSFSFG
jgi:hypothetical protein